jgi:hypothetical protein
MADSALFPFSTIQRFDAIRSSILHTHADRILERPGTGGGGTAVGPSKRPQLETVLRIRDVFPDPGSEFFPSRIRIFSIPARIRIKEFKYFNQKKWFINSSKYDPGSSHRIPDPDPDFLPITDPRSRVKKAPDPESGSATLVRDR